MMGFFPFVKLCAEIISHDVACYAYIVNVSIKLDGAKMSGAKLKCAFAIWRLHTNIVYSTQTIIDKIWYFRFKIWKRKVRRGERTDWGLCVKMSVEIDS